MAKTESRMIHIPDPVHGYIPVEARFMDIVDTPQFQRLRSIEQGSFRPAFPGARHDRFIHSLGTYHLATKFCEHFFANLKADARVTVDPAEKKLLCTTFRYAALLHDVGHAPFSHTTEGLFLEKKVPGTDIPQVWEDLCHEIYKHAAMADGDRFRYGTAKAVGGPHEIVSALVLLRNHKDFTNGWSPGSVDPELAARMIIGYTYPTEGKYAPADPRQIQALGVRNCMIQLLNCSVMDVDRLDYLIRDTRMSGFFNAPLDLDTLARSVTAVEEDGLLQPAFRSSALSAIETMFHAKLSHDAWVLGHPAGAYDAALREHCIRQLDELEESYISNVFCPDALSRDGITFNGKTYRLLSDDDITTDLKAHRDAPFDELFTRALGHRRTAVWNSYDEFRYLFNVPGTILTPDKAYSFFIPLIEYLEKRHIFEFNPKAYQAITADPEADGSVRRAADLLDTYLRKIQAEKKKDENAYSIVLLSRSRNFTLKLDPRKIRIVFTKGTFPKKRGVQNWTTFEKLRNLTGEPWSQEKDWNHDGYFYLFRKGGLGSRQLKTLCDDLCRTLTAEKICT